MHQSMRKTTLSDIPKEASTVDIKLNNNNGTLQEMKRSNSKSVFQLIPSQVGANIINNRKVPNRMQTVYREIFVAIKWNKSAQEH